MCPGATVELHCQTSGSVLIWFVLGAQLDFTIKDTIGASEFSNGIVAELTGRNGGTQSRLWFTMNPSIQSHNVSCFDGLDSEVLCQINQIGQFYLKLDQPMTKAAHAPSVCCSLQVGCHSQCRIVECVVSL